LRALDLKKSGKNPRVGPEHFPAVPYPEPVYVVTPGEGGDGKESKKEERKRASAAVV
jgi:hypothetical protein